MQLILGVIQRSLGAKGVKMAQSTHCVNGKELAMFNAVGSCYRVPWARLNHFKRNNLVSLRANLV